MMCLLMKQIIFTMSMYSLIECIDNYLDISGCLQQIKRDEVPANDADLTTDNSQSFKYEPAPVGKTANSVNNTNSSLKNLLLKKLLFN